MMQKTWQGILILLLLAPLAGLLSGAGASGTGPESGVLALWGSSAAIALGATLVALVAGGLPALILDRRRVRRGGRLSAVLLVLPLALPPWINALVWRDGLLPGADPAAFPGGGPWLMVLCSGFSLFPWVFLLLRHGLATAGRRCEEAARVAGHRPVPAFCCTTLISLLPSLGTACLIVFLETMADYASARILGVETVMTRAFALWFTFDRPAAGIALLSSVVWLFVLPPLAGALLWGRRRRHPAGNTRFYADTAAPPPGVTGRLLCLLPVVAGFLLPAAVLLHRFTGTLTRGHLSSLWPAISGTLLVALPPLVLCGAAAFLLTDLPDSRRRRSLQTAIFMAAAVAWGLPAMATGTGLLLPGGQDSPFRLSGGLLLLTTAMSLRLFAPAWFSTAPAAAALQAGQGDMLRLYGRGPLTLIRLRLGFLRPALLCGLLLVFIGAVQELTLPLLLQGYDYDSLALRLFYAAAAGGLQQAAAPALLILALVLWPVMALAWPAPEPGEGGARG